MGKYYKPICKCGNILVRKLQPAFDVTIAPLKSGRFPELKIKDIHLARMIDDSFPDCLECEVCKTDYEFLTDEKGRLVELNER